MLCDRSRLRNTKILPVGFRNDGDFRQVVLQPGTKYCISAGGEQLNQYIFDLVWPEKSADVLQETEKEYQRAEASAQNPRYARTIEEGPTELPSWYNTRLHTPTVGAVLRTTEGEFLGKGAFGEVRKAVDLDSGCFIAVKKMKLPPKVGPFPSHEEDTLRREVKILSSISHKNIVEYLGSTGWDTGTVHVYMSLKAGNVCDLLEKSPNIGYDEKILTRLLHEMLEALDYLAFRGWCHRDVKPENILYTPSGNEGYVFQLADFGLANQQRLANT
ncbi:NUAK family, SNF1-like kinase, partial [Trematosphaeria pertusa]